LNKDKIIGIIVTLFGLLGLILSFQIEGNAYSTVIGPELFPKIASSGMILCGLGLIIRHQRTEDTPFLDKEGWIRVLKITLAIGMFPVLLIYFGFIVAAVCLVFTTTTLFDMENTLSVVRRLVFSVISAIVIFSFFSYVLDVILPSGKLFGLF